MIRLENVRKRRRQPRLHRLIGAGLGVVALLLHLAAPPGSAVGHAHAAQDADVCAMEPAPWLTGAGYRVAPGEPVLASATDPVTAQGPVSQSDAGPGSEPDPAPGHAGHCWLCGNSLPHLLAPPASGARLAAVRAAFPAPPIADSAVRAGPPPTGDRRPRAPPLPV